MRRYLQVVNLSSPEGTDLGKSDPPFPFRLQRSAWRCAGSSGSFRGCKPGFPRWIGVWPDPCTYFGWWVRALEPA